MKKIVSIILIVLLLGLALAYFFRPSLFSFLPSFGSSAATSTPKMLTSGRPVPAGQREYYNPKYQISLLYPENLKVSEFDEGGGAITITFEDFENSQGFQIFVVPFFESKISTARFKMDIPSGIRKEMKNITVDGATGAAFYSEDEKLGETAEVWFLQGNLLYEVNSFKGLESWLSDIMLTWKFTP